VARSLRAADAQVFLNTFDRDWAVQALGVRAHTATVLPNGVADELLDQPDAVRMASDGRPLALAFLGAWIPRKGIHALMSMVERLEEHGVRYSLRLLGTGAPAAEVRGAFVESARQRITVHPTYRRRELPSLLADAEVLIHPSWTEGFSLALVEAMACGLVPIATRSGGSAAVVVSDETGVLLRTDDDEEMAAAVVRLARNPVERLHMRRAAQARARTLRWDGIAARTLEVYRAAIARRSASR
jgi:glycosyltransferase involved in cell wall biosynthesis